MCSSHSPTTVSSAAEPVQSIASAPPNYQSALWEVVENQSAHAAIRYAWAIRNGYELDSAVPGSSADPEAAVVLGHLPGYACCIIDLEMLTEALLFVCKACSASLLLPC